MSRKLRNHESSPIPTVIYVRRKSEVGVTELGKPSHTCIGCSVSLIFNKSFQCYVSFTKQGNAAKLVPDQMDT
jgi:hypothetical protein